MICGCMSFGPGGRGIAELLFEEDMSAVPQGAFAARRLRQREMLLAKIQQPEQEQPQDNLFYHHRYMELSPLKYNSKLMNSIWGLYNRYSVHNFKKNTDAAAAAGLSGWGPHNSC